jgi:UDP-N-acetylmuramate dehydrogenase
MKAPPFRYHAPDDLASAGALLAQYENARVLAGGQSLMPMMNLRVAGPDHLIDLGRIADLRGIEETPQGLRIGAMVTQRALEKSELVARVCPLLSEAVTHVGHQQTRNRGTLGGSLCHLDPGAELPVAAAALDAVVAQHAAQAGLGGLEFLSGIPGSIGGAVAMNAGAYGTEVKDVLDWAEVATVEGIHRLPAAAFAFAYRHAALPPRAVVTRARFRAAPGDAAKIAAMLGEIRASREATQPVRARTGGSTFKNPADRKAWELIDAAGCRGLSLGAAQVSEKHCNFLLNTGGATAAEIEALGEVVRARVLADSGVALEWEIRRIGVPA